MAESEGTPMTAGQLLGEARRARGLDLPALAAATRISAQFLAALEADEYDILPPLYIRSFLRTYAGALGLPADEVLARLDAGSAGAPPAAGAAPVWEQEVTVRRADGGSRLWLRWAAVALAAVAVVFVAVRLLDHSGRRAFGGGGSADSLGGRFAPASGVSDGRESLEPAPFVPVAVDSSLLPAAAAETSSVDTTRAPRP
jgi:hypothetical protein